MPPDIYKLLGPISIAIAVAAALVLLKTWPKGRAASISQHAGAQRRSYWLFAGVLISDGLLFFLFMWRWFVPALHLPGGYMGLLVLGFLLQLATAVIPDKGDHGRVSKLHAWVAFSMAVVMMLLTGWLAFAPYASAFSRWLAALAFVGMGTFWYLFLFVKSSRQHFLVYQTSYIASFYICILAAAYL